MSDIPERVVTAGKTHSMELIFFPVFILLIVGVFANNLSNVNLQTTPVLPATCQIVAICYPTNTNGCDASNSNCIINSTTKFSFLNSNSPFAFLLQGNLLGFFSCLAGCPQTSPVSNFFYVGGCTDFLTDKNNSFITNLYCANIHLYSANGGVPFAPYNATGSAGNNSNWYVAGQPNPTGASEPTYQFYGIYKANGSSFVNTYCDAVKICFNKTVFTCVYTNQSPFNTTNVEFCLAAYNINTSVTTLNFFNSFSVFGFIFGLFLTLAGLGLYIAFQLVSSGATMAVNEQATKMCEVFGFGLLLWSFLYGEFGSWLNNLPLNLGTIAFLTFTLMFFMGLYWRLFSLD